MPLSCASVSWEMPSPARAVRTFAPRARRAARSGGCRSRLGTPERFRHDLLDTTLDLGQTPQPTSARRALSWARRRGLRACPLRTIGDALSQRMALPGGVLRR